MKCFFLYGLITGSRYSNFKEYFSKSILFERDYVISSSEGFTKIHNSTTEGDFVVRKACENNPACDIRGNIICTSDPILISFIEDYFNRSNATSYHAGELITFTVSLGTVLGKYIEGLDSPTLRNSDTVEQSRNFIMYFNNNRI